MTDSGKFSLPRDGRIYTKTIFDRCRNLIAYNIWSGLPRHRLDAWIANFRSEEEKYFAARILDSLIYRSSFQTFALIRQLFQRTIPDLQRKNNLSRHLSTVYMDLKHSKEVGIRIVPAMPPDEAKIKSAAVIGRHIKRQLEFRKEWFDDAQNVPDLISQGYSIIFVDDLLGTGTQFMDFVEDLGLEKAVNSGKCIYTPLVGHVNGLKNVRAEYPNLNVDAVEILDDSHAIFHPDSGIFPDDANSAEAARDFYHELLANRGIPLQGPDRRGFGQFELTYAFEHAVPDNSLPILWWDDTTDWQPLFNR